MRALGLGQRLEPVSDLVVTFITSIFRHARVHVGVLVRFAGDRCSEVFSRRTDRQARGRVANFFEVFEMAVCVAGFAFSRGAEYCRDVVVTLYVSFGCEVQVATVCLRFAGNCIFKVLLGFAAFQ